MPLTFFAGGLDAPLTLRLGGELESTGGIMSFTCFPFDASTNPSLSCGGVGPRSAGSSLDKLSTLLTALKQTSNYLAISGTLSGRAVVSGCSKSPVDWLLTSSVPRCCFIAWLPHSVVLEKCSGQSAHRRPEAIGVLT